VDDPSKTGRLESSENLPCVGSAWTLTNGSIKRSRSAMTAS
jgi:hypothetical protein